MTTTRDLPPVPGALDADDGVVRDDALSRLAALPGAGRVALRAGQVLLYAGHLAPGLFVVVAGSIEVASRPGAGGGRLLSAAVRPIVVPGPDDIDARSPSDVVLAGDARAVFVPRSVAVGHPEVATLLAELGARPAGRWRDAQPVRTDES